MNSSVKCVKSQIITNVKTSYYNVAIIICHFDQRTDINSLEIINSQLTWSPTYKLTIQNKY